MSKAILRAAAVGRLGMFIAILTIVTLARLAGAIREGDAWVGSESQATVAVLVLWLVLPVFVTMLATVLLRGEHAPWTWVLARPVSRVRLIGSLVALDFATIAGCMFAAWLVLGGFGGMWGMLAGTPDGIMVALVAFLYINVYMVAAVAGRGTASSVRAAAIAVITVAVLVGSVSSLMWSVLDGAVGSFGVHETWARGYVLSGIVGWNGPTALDEPHTWWLLSGLVLVSATVSAPVSAFVATARFSPGSVRLRRVASRTVALVGLSAFLCFAGWVNAYVTAPPEARTGDVTLLVVPHVVEADLRVHTIRLEFDAPDVPRGWTTLHPEDDRDENSIFVGLSAGTYEVCATVTKRMSTPTAGERHNRARRCMPVAVTDAPQQELSIDITFDGIQASPSPLLVANRENTLEND